MTIRELRKLLDTLTDDFEIFLSSDEEGNNYYRTNMKFGTAVYPEDKALILYPNEGVEYEDMLPIANREDLDEV